MSEGFEQLYLYIKHGNITAVETFLNQGGDPNLCNCGGWNLLMAAAFKGNSRILKLLLDRGAVLEAATVVGETALALAAGGGYIKCVSLLLESGASIHIHPLGHPLSKYIELRGGLHPSVQKTLAGAGAS